MTVSELREWLANKLPFDEIVFYDVDTSETLSAAFDQAKRTGQDEIWVPVFKLEKL